jgi:hypothetical protein
LSTGAELRAGEAESVVARKVPAALRVGEDLFERVADGERMTRVYDDGVRRFMVVFDPLARTAERRIVALYLP